MVLHTNDERFAKEDAHLWLMAGRFALSTVIFAITYLLGTVATHDRFFSFLVALVFCGIAFLDRKR